MADGKPVEIKPAKGRPMLTWVGKRPLRNVTAYPAQLIETYLAKEGSGLSTPDVDWSDWPQGFPQSGLLFNGDNKDVLAHLLASGFRGKVKLIYIDPPFDSGADYVRKVTLRGAATQLDGEGYTIGEQVQYTDIWANDNYLQFMFERLLLLKELLANDGSIYLHSDSHRSHMLRCLLDEVFGPENFRNDIVWQRFNYRADGKKFGTVHDTILFYTKSDSFTFQKPYVTFKPSYIKSHFRVEEGSGRLYRLDNFSAPAHGKTGKAQQFGDKVISPPPGTMWRFAQSGIDDLWSKGLIVISDGGIPQIKRYLDETEGQAVHSIWTDVSSINSQSLERSNYPTQKPEILLERVIEASSNVGDIILDCFIGSGTTASVAQKLGRRWIGADINKGAIQTTTKRLKRIVQEQISTQANAGMQLPGLEDEQITFPCQMSFSVYRVNDYDLQIQHNEAFNLAVEHLGLTRTKTDAFFDGTLGKRLVKITLFNHPLTPLDLEEVKNELSNRPEESRDIAVVCLGKELSVGDWLEDWNRIRRQGDFPNKIDVIELRTDPKYGGFFVHEPAQAEVKFERSEDCMTVTVENFLSPTIIQRLEQQAAGPLLKPQITDWRAMVDSIMIDANYDGQVFNITLADVPEKKADLVNGKYRVETPEGATVAVKITDMLGEEVLVIETL